MPYRLMEPRFPLGEVYTSATSAARLAEDELLQILHRHHCGDWGDLGDGDKQANEEALQTDARILSRYDLECGSFYIVTIPRDMTIPRDRLPQHNSKGQVTPTDNLSLEIFLQPS